MKYSASAAGSIFNPKHCTKIQVVLQKINRLGSEVTQQELTGPSLGLIKSRAAVDEHPRPTEAFKSWLNRGRGEGGLCGAPGTQGTGTDTRGFVWKTNKKSFLFVSEDCFDVVVVVAAG